MVRRLLPHVVRLMGLYIAMRKLKKRRGPHAIRKLRPHKGAYYSLLPEVKRDPAEFRKYTRMSRPSFDKLLDQLKARYEKYDLCI